MSRKTQPPEKTPECLSRRIEIACVVSLLLLHLLICLHTAVSESVTHDEIWHLPVGVRNLREGRFDIELVNPPLTRMWAAIPLVLAGVEVDEKITGQAVGKQFVEDHPQDFPHWYRWGRTFQLVWSLATAGLVFFWARHLFGAEAGLVSLLLYATCPNIAAHASVVTPDAGMMFGFVATLFTLTLWCDRPDWKRTILWGTLLGFSEGIKFTGLLLYPLVAAIACLRLWQTHMPETATRRGLLCQFFSAIGISLIVLCGCYGFQGLFVPLSKFQFQSIEFLSLQRLAGVFSNFPVPLPAEYLRGIDEQRFVMAGAHPVYLDGQWSLTGFRSYFLMGMLYKLPHPFQFLLIVAAVRFCIGWRKAWRDQCALLLPVILLLVVASGESLQLGIRYVLPVLPLLMIFASSTVSGLSDWSSKARQLIAILLVIACLFSLRSHPHHLAYFNEYAGGPIGGREHLLDSNLDWGQDLHGVKDYLKEQGIDSIGLAYFGTVPPQLLGIEFELPPSWNPKPGLYAVSVNFVMGRPHGIIQGDGASRSVDFQEFGYFRFFEPVKTLGGSIDIYDLSEADIEEWNHSMREFKQGNR